MFRLVGFHLPLGALSSPERRAAACTILRVDNNYSEARRVSSLVLCPGQFQLGFNPAIYSVSLDGAGMKKQTLFRNTAYASREAYKDDILKELTSNDVRVLVKTAEEFSQCRRFSRVFPSKDSHTYFPYFDSVSYYDKLLDAFEMRFSGSYEEGLKFIDEYCKKNVHQFY